MTTSFMNTPKIKVEVYSDPDAVASAICAAVKVAAAAAIKQKGRL
jgi:hypothetical protein